ncbi:MAG: AAA family ATPase [Acidobacteriota bacterium]
MNTPRQFPIDEHLLNRARQVLCRRRQIFWILGGACSGKTTLSAHLSKKKGISVYDMDAHIFSEYMPRYSRRDHPASRAWFDQPNPLEWILSLSWEEFDALNAATNIEYLDLFAQDICQMDADRTLIVDGGIAHPALLARVLDPTQLVCLKRDASENQRSWEVDENRADMKQSVLALPDGETAWRKFLCFDQCLTETLLKECQETLIKIVAVDSTVPFSEIADLVLRYWRLS